MTKRRLCLLLLVLAACFGSPEATWLCNPFSATLRQNLTVSATSGDLVNEKQKTNQEENSRSNRHAQFTGQRSESVIVVVFVVLAAMLTLVLRGRQLLKKAHRKIRAKNRIIDTKEAEIIWQAQQLAALATELKRMQSQLIHSEKMASLGEMTSGIVNELNNPLNFISGGIGGLINSVSTLSILLRNPGDPERAHIGKLEDDSISLLQSARIGVFRLNKIIESLRMFASPQVDAFGYVNIVGLMEMALTLLNGKITAADTTVVRNYSCEAVHIQGNGAALCHVFVNMIDNAIQATEGRDKKELCITIQRTDTEVVICIKDTGHGIPGNIKDKVLEPFFTTKPIGKGAGLGLSVCHEIIKAHCGKLDFTSEVNEGTEFTIVMAIQEAAADNLLASSA